MTRQAVEAGFERFVTDAIAATAGAFRVTAALQGTTTNGPAGLIDRLIQDSETIQRRVVEPTLAEYRSAVLAQFAVILDATESAEPIETYRDEILARDAYAKALRADLPASRREAIESQLLDRAAGLGEAVEPLLATSEDEFWPALLAAYTQEDAQAVVERWFRFTGPIREHPDAFVFSTQLDPETLLGGIGGLLAGGLPTVSLDFTDEAIRAMKRGEETVVHDTMRELQRRYEAVDRGGT